MSKNPEGVTSAPEYPPAYQQPQYPQQQQPQQQYPYQQYPHVVVQQAPVCFQQYPVTLQCPHCQQQVTTTVVKQNGLVPWLACGGLVLFGCVLGCCFIPFCIEGLKDAIHKCPQCNKVVGHFKHI